MEALDNRLDAPYFAPAYYLRMAGNSFKDRVIQAMKASDVSKAELSRRSGVPYHTLDKWLKRPDATTGADNASALAHALGITVDSDSEYEELRELFYRLEKPEQTFVLKTVKGLLGVK